jgi:hypothetical protein
MKHNTFTLCESWTCSSTAWSSMPQMHTLWQFSLPHTWKVALSLKTIFLTHLTHCCWKSTQNWKLRLWSYNSCSQYPFTRRSAQNVPVTLLRHLQFPAPAMCWLLRVPDKSFLNMSNTLGRWPWQTCLFCSTQATNLLEFLVPVMNCFACSGSVWYLVWNIQCPWQMTQFWHISSFKTRKAFLFPVHAMFHHDDPLAVKLASIPQHLSSPPHKKIKLGEILYPLTWSFLVFSLGCWGAGFGSFWVTHELPCITYIHASCQYSTVCC